jgi:hypothetical protein
MPTDDSMVRNSNDHQKQKGPQTRAFHRIAEIQGAEFVDQRLPPDFCGLANVAETEFDTGCDFAAAAFFGLRISRFERVWPLAMADLLRLNGGSP